MAIIEIGSPIDQIHDLADMATICPEWPGCVSRR